MRWPFPPPRENPSLEWISRGIGEINLPPKASATEDPPELGCDSAEASQGYDADRADRRSRARSIDQASERYSSICMKTAENRAKTATMMQTTAIRK